MLASAAALYYMLNPKDARKHGAPPQAQHPALGMAWCVVERHSSLTFRTSGLPGHLWIFCELRPCGEAVGSSKEGLQLSQARLRVKAV